MNFLQKVFSFGGGKKKTITLSELARKFGSNSSWNDGKLMKQYSSSVYVYACITVIAKYVANIDLHLHKVLNSTGDSQEVFDDPVLSLVHKFNPFQTRTEFLKTTIINKKLTGKAFWYKVRNERGDVVELWNLRPDLVRVNPDPENFIKSYTVSLADGGQQDIAPDDVVYFRDPDPLNMHDGLSPIEASQTRIDTEQHATQYQRDFFLNNARPDAFLKTEEELTPAQVGEMRSAWNEKHQGVGKNGEIGILYGGLDYHQISINQREMDYIESLKFTRDDILVAFGVPKSIITTDDVNRANAEAGLYMFLTQTIKPEMQQIVEVLNEFLVAPDFGENLYFTYTDPTPEDRTQQLNEFTQGVDKWITRNEIRSRIGLEPIENGDELYGALTNVPIGEVIPQEVSADEKAKIFQSRRFLKEKFLLMEAGQKAVKGAVKQYEDDQQKTKEKRTKSPACRLSDETSEQCIARKVPEIIAEGFDEDQARAIAGNVCEVDCGEKKKHRLIRGKELREKYITMVNKIIDRRSKKFKRELQKELVKQQTRVNERLMKSQIIKAIELKEKVGLDEINQAIGLQAENELMASFALPFITDFVNQAGQDALNIVNDGKEFNITLQVQNSIQKRAEFFANSINETTFKKMTESLSEGIGAGEGVLELSERVGDVYESYPDYRLDLIARTEATFANNDGFLQAYQQSNVVGGKEWIATVDGRTRAEHLALNGTVVGINNSFPNGLEYPQEPNCRCVLGPALLEG